MKKIKFHQPPTEDCSCDYCEAPILEDYRIVDGEKLCAICYDQDYEKFIECREDVCDNWDDPDNMKEGLCEACWEVRGSCSESDEQDLDDFCENLTKDQ